MKLKKKYQPLHNVSVLVTRPEHQAEPFCHRLKQAGAKVFVFPVIEIITRAIKPEKKDLPDHQDILLFTSSNAVTFSLQWLKSFIKPDSQTLPCSIGAIGKKTALALNNHQINVDIQPLNNFNSESLLTLPSMKAVTDKKVLIIKGEGGRTLLGDTLSERGATVRYLNVYKRQCPTPNNEILTRLRQERIDIITLTSTEGCINLFATLQHQNISWLTKATLLLGSSRIQKNIAHENINNPYWLADNPADNEMYASLLEWLKWKAHHIE